MSVIASEFPDSDDEMAKPDGGASTKESDAPTPLSAGKPSQKQIDANRRNAQLSTGPKTAEGKSKASQNAVRHGLLAKNVFVPGSEEEAHFRALHEDLLNDLMPIGTLEETLVAEMAFEIWRLNRARVSEAGYILRREQQAKTRMSLDQKNIARDLQKLRRQVEFIETCATELQSRDFLSTGLRSAWPSIPGPISFPVELIEASETQPLQAHCKAQVTGRLNSLLEEQRKMIIEQEFLLDPEATTKMRGLACPYQGLDLLLRYETQHSRRLERRLRDLSRMQQERLKRDAIAHKSQQSPDAAGDSLSQIPEEDADDHEKLRNKANLQ